MKRVAVAGNGLALDRALAVHPMAPPTHPPGLLLPPTRLQAPLHGHQRARRCGAAALPHRARVGPLHGRQLQPALPGGLWAGAPRGHDHRGQGPAGESAGASGLGGGGAPGSRARQGGGGVLAEAASRHQAPRVRDCSGWKLGLQVPQGRGCKQCFDAAPTDFPVCPPLNLPTLGPSPTRPDRVWHHGGHPLCQQCHRRRELH
jgi:hypothetical protein